MTLLNCPECGHDVSSWAATCLHCGCPVSKFDAVTEEKDAIYKVGSVIEFGSYSWIVLRRDGGDVLLISEKAIVRDAQYFKKIDATNWAKSTIRRRLNGKFLESFDSGDRSKILLTNVKNLGNPEYGTKGCSDTEDRIFCLSIEEAESLMTEEQRKIGEDWWLRSPGDARNGAAYVNADGSISEEGLGVYYYLTVRPAMWVRL